MFEPQYPIGIYMTNAEDWVDSDDWVDPDAAYDNIRELEVYDDV